ncbi:hypothetical protein KY284_035685 [Solanum tuberosum]|nr:hypothetical protein KY284_035685 [Solanum tuberosum]
MGYLEVLRGQFTRNIDLSNDMPACEEYRSTLPLESRDRSFTQEENENLWKQSAGEPIRGSVYGYPEKTYQKKKAWYCGSSSSSFDGGDRETISTMEGNIAFLNAELAAVADIEK